MNMLGKTLLSRALRCINPSLPVRSLRAFCSEGQMNTNIEKSVNHVTLLGRVGIDPQLRGTETNPVVIFTLATNSNFKGQGEMRQKTEWHRISIFKPYLRDTVQGYLKKGSRVYVNGKILYGEIVDGKGVRHQTTTIVADDVIFVGSPREATEDLIEAEG